MNLAKKSSLTQKEVRQYITWLESEIDQCMMYDIPLDHLKKELFTLYEILEIGTVSLRPYFYESEFIRVQ